MLLDAAANQRPTTVWCSQPGCECGPGRPLVLGDVAQPSVASAARWRARKGKSRSSRRPSLAAEEASVKRVYRRCAGLDIHMKSVTACVLVAQAKGEVEVHKAVFGTFTND